MKNLSLIICGVLLCILSCKQDLPVQPRVNQPPRTFLWLFPDSTIAQGVSKQRIRWWGEDPDGFVTGFLFAVDSARSSVSGIPNPDTLNWSWITKNDTLISFPLRAATGMFTVFVRAVDNTIGTALPEQSQIRFTPSPFWDKNSNGIFDSPDQFIPSLSTASDAGGANQQMPLKNQPPTIRFANDPFDPTRTLQQPETTFTAATFAWEGSDFDGDETILEYTIALNDTSDSSRFVTLPANVTLISLFVPRSRSDNATGEVTADVYRGNFLSRQLIRTLPGLKLDSLNTFYVRARDVAGEYSFFIQMPQGGGRWFVRKPKSSVLTVIDYIASDLMSAKNFYRGVFSQVGSGQFGNYDELDIGRGISATDKNNAASGIGNPVFGVLVPRFLDPAFLYTLFLFDYVFWYTDQFPSLPAAQFALFHYRNVTFDGRRGRILFSTTFGTNPDPRGVLRDFAPIDSVSSVDLGPAHLLPTFGDSRIPGGYQLIADSSDLSNIYSTLAFNTGAIHSVFMRPIYKQPDGRYIYRMQEDTRPQIRYTYLITLDSLQSVGNAGINWVIAVGNNGTIVRSTDGGNSWAHRASGVDRTLRSIHFVNANQGWAVGDGGTILSTNDGGDSWLNRSVVTTQNLLGVRFLDAQNGIVVGTKGIIIKTTDGGSSWNSLFPGTSRNIRAVDFLDVNTAVAVGDSGLVVKTSDGGTGWNRKLSGTFQNLFAVHFPQGSMTGYAVGAGGVIRKSTDVGETWLSPPSRAVSLRSVYFFDALNGWIVGNSGGIFSTSDGGANWIQRFSGGTNQTLTSAAFSSSTDGIIAASGGVIIKTQDGGLTWSFQPKGPLNVGVINGTKRFVFLGLPLHLLNGQNTVKDFLQHVFLSEFGP